MAGASVRHNEMSSDPGPLASSPRGTDPELQREIEEHAAHYAELHPDGAARTDVRGFVRRLGARLLGRRDTGGSAVTSEEVWAREEARYRAKDAGKPQA